MLATLGLLITAFCVAAYGDDAPQGTDGSASHAARILPPMVDHHRPIRGNPPLAPEQTPRDIGAVTATPESAGFSVVPRLPELTWYPCQQCHEVIPANTERRLLYVPHHREVFHGAEQFWCHDCHTPEAEERLHTLDGKPADFNSSYQLCAQCHYQPRRDWFYGAHGKRVENWQGERSVYSCTHCHDPHNPAVRPRPAQPPPPLRRGLEPLEASGHHHETAPFVPAIPTTPATPAADTAPKEPKP